MLPFLIDTIGNALDLYDTIDWWDDANHFVNWALLSGALAAALARTHIGALELFGLVVGFGGVTAILWEIGEYFAFIRGGTELATAYTDTLGDEILGLWAQRSRGRSPRSQRGEPVGVRLSLSLRSHLHPSAISIFSKVTGVSGRSRPSRSTCEICRRRPGRSSPGRTPCACRRATASPRW